MPTPNGVPCRTGPDPKSNALAKAVSRQQSVRELREMQERVLAKALDPKTNETQLYYASRSYVVLREAIRIEKGWIKPGSRNISVREGEKPVKRVKRHRPVNELDGAARALGLLPAIDVLSEPTTRIACETTTGKSEPPASEPV